MGPSGPAGEQGPSGISIQSVEIIDSELFVTFDNGTIQNAGIINIPGGSIVLDPAQYIFSFNSTFGQLELEIIDPAILDSYIRLGISVRVYDNTGSSVYSNNFDNLYAGDPTNMAGLLSLTPGSYTVEFSFLSDEGLIIVNDSFSF